MAMDSLADIRSYNWGRTEMQQPLPPEPQHGGELPPLSSRVWLPPPWLQHIFFFPDNQKGKEQGE